MEHLHKRVVDELTKYTTATKNLNFRIILITEAIQIKSTKETKTKFLQRVEDTKFFFIIEKKNKTKCRGENCIFFLLSYYLESILSINTNKLANPTYYSLFYEISNKKMGINPH